MSVPISITIVDCSDEFVNSSITIIIYTITYFGNTGVYCSIAIITITSRLRSLCFTIV